MQPSIAPSKPQGSSQGPQPARIPPGVEALRKVLRQQRDQRADGEADAMIKLELAIVELADRDERIAKLEATEQSQAERIAELELELASLKRHDPDVAMSPEPPPAASPRTH